MARALLCVAAGRVSRRPGRTRPERQGREDRMRRRFSWFAGGHRLAVVLSAALPVLLLARSARAEDAVSPGDTAWMMTSTALVLMMTVPGLALFYGGLVRAKNVLSILMQCLISAALIW